MWVMDAQTQSEQSRGALMRVEQIDLWCTDPALANAYLQIVTSVNFHQPEL